MEALVSRGDVEGEARERERLLDAIRALRREIARRIVGQEAVIDEVLMALLAGGHALLVGVPGLAKTLLIQTIAEATHLSFRRIQFTPDLVPSDVTGTEIMEEDPLSRRRSFRFVEGPIFANVVLADEINRTPPRTQAALLEAMQERRVTTAGATRPLPAPFFVLATQNPIEQEGTYPLPEAQLDRFLFDIRVEYPDEADEIAILRQTTGVEQGNASAVLSSADTLALERLVRQVPVAESVLRYATLLVRATRPTNPSASAIVKHSVRWGAGPRAGQALILGAKANALLSGRPVVSPADVQRVAVPVLRHRIILSFAAQAEGVTVEQVIAALCEAVPTPRSDIRL